MKLFHVSECGGIERFEPRMPPSADSGVTSPVVWAVDEPHLANYLLPRDCPRVCFRVSAKTTTEDRARFMTAPTANIVVAIKSDWQERAAHTTLHVYEFEPKSFYCADSNAGYFVSPVAVTTIRSRTIPSPLRALEDLGVDLRIMPDLQELAASVAASTLAFSCIRMKRRPHPPS